MTARKAGARQLSWNAGSERRNICLACLWCLAHGDAKQTRKGTLHMIAITAFFRDVMRDAGGAMSGGGRLTCA